MAAQTTPNHNEVRQEIDRVTFLHNDSITLEINSSGINCQNSAPITNYPIYQTANVVMNNVPFTFPIRIYNIGNIHFVIGAGSATATCNQTNYATVNIAGSLPVLPSEEIGVTATGIIDNTTVGPMAVRLDQSGVLWIYPIQANNTTSPVVGTMFQSGVYYQIDGFVLVYVA